MSEIERIKKAYDKRVVMQKYKFYSYFNKANLCIIHQREKALLEVIKKFNFSDLSNKKILDVGCGKGDMLRNFIQYGARPENLYGLDLVEDRIEQAKALSPNIDFRCANAENLPYPDKSFDIVMQFVVFTSIFDSQMKKNIGKEMLRVLKPNGIIIWYDFYYNNPWNPDVRGIKKREIYQIFPDCKIYLKRITVGIAVAVPIIRVIASYSYFLCCLLESIKILNTHYLGVIKKK